MVRKMDYEVRRKAVLAAVINRYIQEGSPVASEDIAKDFQVSSATVRNVFADLEDAGYLAHMHTSSGRIPTYKGYRYYVDFLVEQMELVEEEKFRISSEYRKKISHLEELLETTSALIAGVTHYAGITLFPEWQDKLFYGGLSQILDQPEFHDSQKIRYLIKTLEEKRRLLEIMNRDFEDKVRVYIGEELECPEISNCSLIVSRYRIKNKPGGKIAVLGPMRMEYNHAISVLGYVADMLTYELDKI